jgi:adenylylsulfate kinase
VRKENSNIVWHEHKITKEQRMTLSRQKPCILWFTGLSGSGKSTVANAVEEMLFNLQKHSYLLDGDNIRHRLNRDLGFSNEDRVENIRRIGEVSKLFVDAGLIVLTAFISPFQEDRAIVRELVDEDEFIEIFIDTPLQVCEERDPKGLYAKARKGEIADFTGINSPYEAPENPEIHIRGELAIEESADIIISYLRNKNYI